MRNPLPVLAAAMLAAAGAFAAELPTWKTTDEPFGAWRVIDFTDASGAGHHLYCRWSECGSSVKSGQAPLYVLERAGDEPYTATEPYRPQYAGTYAGKTWEWLKGKTTNVQFQSTKTTFKSEVSHFVLDMSAQPNKAVIKGTTVAIPVEPEREAVSPTGWIFRVLAPVAVADDAPKAASRAPANPNVPLPRPRPKSPATTQPAPKPGAHAATELSVLERYWLIPTERTAYDDSIAAAKKPSAAARQAAYKKGRETVSANLREELKAPYNALVAGGQFDKIDALLADKNYSGYEVMLRPEEYEALKTVLKTADAHADFTEPNAAAQYDAERKSILGKDGKPKLNEHVLAHKITEKFRAMVPKKPGDAVDPFAPLTDADFARIADKAKRDDLKKQYDEAWAKADTNDKKAAVNKDFRARIEQRVAAAAPTKPATPFNPADINTLDKLKALPKDDQKKFCSALSSDAGALANCGDILGNASAATTKCMAATGADATATAKAKADCMAQINACKAQPNASTGIPSAHLPKKMREYCATLLAHANDPLPTIGGSSSAAGSRPSAIDSSPCQTDATKVGSSGPGKDVNPCPDKDKKDDPNLYTNIGNGLSFGLGGLILASFFGGPALMLAVAVAAGIGGYYFAKAADEPKKKKK